MYNRGADDNGTQRSQAPDSPGQPTEYQQIIDYGQRSLSYLQVIGEDVFEEARNFKINWNGGLGQAQLQEPDQRQFTYGLTDSGTYIDLDGTTSEADATDDTLQRFQRELTENSYYGIVDFTIPMFEEKERTDAFKTGFYQDYSQRDYTQTSFNYPYGLSPTPGLPSQESYTPTNGETWADVFLSPDRSGLINPTGALGPYMMSYSIFNQAGDTGANGNNPGTDYQASQGVTASYLMADFKPFPQLTLVGGTRFENTNIKIFGATNLPARYFPDFNGVSKIQQLDLLPAVSATFELTQGVNIRMAWSQTLARPSFKEMGPVITKDFTDDSYFLGNPDLQLSKANNYDFRVEWFPRAGEVLSLSLFYKDLQAPLEQTSFYDPVTELNFFKYQNASTGTIRGLEFEARKRLDQLSSALRQFSLFFNYTYIASSVPITGQTAEFIDQSTRPLQGQPEYVINAGLNYDNDEYRFYAGLFYNVTGPLLYAAGAPVVEDGRVLTFFPDIYQQPAPSLDLNITQGLTDNWKLTFRGKNLLNPWFNQTQTLNGTEYIFSSYTRGWDVSLNAAYSF
jgi:TonB-dependent receptor